MSQPTCEYCQSYISTDNNVTIMDCKHIYHTSCLIENSSISYGKIMCPNKLCFINRFINSFICKKQIFIKQNNGECSICLENISNINISITKCKHCFHTSCLTKNISMNGHNCPNCRRIIATDISALNKCSYPSSSVDYDYSELMIQHILERLQEQQQQQLTEETNVDNNSNIFRFKNFDILHFNIGVLLIAIFINIKLKSDKYLNN